MVTAVMHEDAVALANRLRPVLLHIDRHLRREAQIHGISAARISMLVAIHDHPGIGVADLAAREGMSSPSASIHLDRLESDGYVRRVREASDRRRVGLEITPAGARLLRTVRSRRTMWLAARLESLSAEQRSVIAGSIDALRALVERR